MGAVTLFYVYTAKRGDQIKRKERASLEKKEAFLDMRAQRTRLSGFPSFPCRRHLSGGMPRTRVKVRRKSCWLV